MNRFYQLLLGLTGLLLAGRAAAQTGTTPTGLNVNVTYGGAICLQWTPNTTTAIPYEVERSDDGRGGWSKVGDSAPVASGPFSGGNYCDENLPSLKTYYYRVRGSLGRNTYTSYSTTTFGTTKAAPSTPSLTLTPEAGAIRVGWTTQLSTNYELERRDGQRGTFQVVNTQNSGRNGSLAFISSGNAGSEYCFRVRAKDAQAGTSAYSDIGCQTIPTAASNIRNFAANANGSPNSIKLTWDRYGKESPITIERSEDGGRTWGNRKDWLADSGEYTDTGLQANKEYCYRIQESGRNVSETKCATTAAGTPVRPGPLNVLVKSATELQPYWGDNNVVPVTFELEQATGPAGTYRVIASGLTQSQKIFDVRDLVPATQYCYRVRAKNSAGVYSDYSDVVCATTQAPPVSVPSPPTDLLLQVISARQINMIWKDNSNNETGFRVERSEDGGRTWTKISDERENATSFDNTGLSPDKQYCYRVQAVNGAGGSRYSNEPCATTQPDKPGTPARLTATATSSSQIRLEWVNTAGNATGIQVERSETGSGGSFTKVKDLGPGETNWTDEGLAASKEYCYRIRAINAAGNGDYTEARCATTQAPPVLMPSPPTNLGATAVSASQINLSWTPSNSTFGNGYIIEQASPQGGAYRAIAEVNGLATSAFSVTGLAASTQYCFRLRTRYTTNSDASNEACQTTLAPPVTLPRPPSNLNVTAQSPTDIKLTWTDNSDNEAEFEIWWATSQTAQFTRLTNVPADTKEYLHTGLTASSPYCYQVRAINTAGQSTFAGPLCATTQAPPPTAPAAPTDFVANAASTSSVNLGWKDISNNETGFELQFSLNNADPWTSLPTQTSNVTAFTHPGLTANTRYYYRLRAVNGVGPSAWVTANTTTPALPLPSTNTDLKAEVADYDQIKLTWGAITNNPTAIVIERATSPTGSFTQVGQVTGTSVTFTDTGLPEMTTFYYRIRSANANGPSGNSNVAFATTPEAIIAVRPQPLPEGIYAHVAHGTLFVTLNWNQFQEAKLRVVGLNGREQLTDQCRINGGTLFQYDVAHLPGGVYVLCLDTDKNRFTKKIWIP